MAKIRSRSAAPDDTTVDIGALRAAYLEVFSKIGISGDSVEPVLRGVALSQPWVRTAIARTQVRSDCTYCYIAIAAVDDSMHSVTVTRESSAAFWGHGGPSPAAWDISIA